MPHLVDVPDLGTVEFPDDMSEDQINQAIKKHLGEKPTLQIPGSALDIQPPVPPPTKPESGMESGTEFTTALAGGAQEVAAKAGKGLEKAGKAARDVAAAYAFELLGQPELQSAQLGVRPEDVKSAGMIPEPESEKTPIELGIEQFPGVAQIPSKAAYGLIETAPKLAAVAGAQALGVPAPLAAGAVFGLTPEGFSPKDAAIAASMPFLGKYSGEIATAVAKKFGVTSAQALNAVKGASAIAGASAPLVADQEFQIQKLPEEQRKQARIDMWANIAGQSLLGLGEFKAEPGKGPSAVEEGKIPESGQPEYIGTEAQRIQAEPGGGDRPVESGEVPQGQEARQVLLTGAEAAAKETGLTFKPQGPIQEKGLTPEELAQIPKLWEFTDRRVGSPTEGMTIYVPEGASKEQIVSQWKSKQKEVESYQQTYSEIGTGNETKAEAMHGTPSGLPKGVPDNGPNFPIELMTASKRLGTMVRTRATLGPGVLGQYRRNLITQDDAIEVGNLRNQLTVSHEMGHDLDALIFQNNPLGHSQQSLVDRIGAGVTKKELFNELVPVSELMRGPISGSPGHQTYRRRASELIADWFALYAHDPDRARAMAPKWSKGFEKVLAQSPDAEQVIKELHAGNVEPAPPSVAEAPTVQEAGMPGKIPARPKVEPVPRDAQLVVAAEDLVKGQIRRFQSEVQRARVKADTWREDVPDPADRNDVGAFVEGVSNLEIPGDTIDAVRSRMSPAKKQFAKEFTFAMEEQRGKINAYLKDAEQGEYLKFLEDYLPHFYANAKTPAGRAATARFIKDSPSSKQRKIPTLREAVDYGLTPITQDPATLFEISSRINWRVATNRDLLAKLKDMRSAGEPIVMPAGKAPPGWPISDNPLIQRVYARQAGENTLLWKGGAAIHPDAWRAVRQMLDTPTSSELGKAYDAINSLTRANAFAFSLFHDLTLRSASLGAQMSWFNPARGLFRLFERDPNTGELKIFQSTRKVGKELLKDEETVADAAQHGLVFSWTDSDSYQHAARDFLEKAAVNWKDIPVLGKATKLAQGLQAWRQEGLWKNTHDAYKIAAYDDLTSKALQEAPPGTDAKEVKERVASLLNDAFGGQEWQTKFWMSPQVRQKLARFWLAPDWTFSTLRSVPFLSDAASTVRGNLPRIAGREPIPTAKEGLSGDMSRVKFWGAEITALAAATVATQYAIYHAFGDKNKGDKEWVWENEKGQDRRIDVTPIMRRMPWKKPDDPTRYYVNLGKRPEEIMGWVIHPEMNLQSKLARPVVEVFRQITGTEGDFKAEWKRDHESFLESIPERAKAAAGQLVPFTFSGNQFVLSLPMRKGMTKYKAQQAYESAYELVAQPSKLRAIVREQTTNLDKLIDDIGDAAERNGVNAEIVRKRALSITRGKYYDKFFKAMEKEDEKAMEDAANALGRLGATQRGLQESMKRKYETEPQ